MDITGTYSFYLNNINIASNFVKEYKKLHIIYSRPLVIKYKTQIKEILKIFHERNDVKKEEIEKVEKIFAELNHIDDELYQKEKAELKKLYAKEENIVQTSSTANNFSNVQKKYEELLMTRSQSYHSSDESISNSSLTEDRYDSLVRASNDLISEAITKAHNEL